MWKAGTPKFERACADARGPDVDSALDSAHHFGGGGDDAVWVQEMKVGTDRRRSGAEPLLDPKQEDTVPLAFASRKSDSIRAKSDGGMRRTLSSGPRRSWRAAWPSTSRGRHPRVSGTPLESHGGLAAEADPVLAMWKQGEILTSEGGDGPRRCGHRRDEDREQWMSCKRRGERTGRGEQRQRKASQVF